MIAFLCFAQFTHENPKGQKYLLGGFELLVGNVHKETLLPKVPRILKAFYDNDIIDEEIIIDWGKKVNGVWVWVWVDKLNQPNDMQNFGVNI